MLQFICSCFGIGLWLIKMGSLTSLVFQSQDFEEITCLEVKYSNKKYTFLFVCNLILKISQLGNHRFIITVPQWRLGGHPKVRRNCKCPPWSQYLTYWGVLVHIIFLFQQDSKNTFLFFLCRSSVFPSPTPKTFSLFFLVCRRETILFLDN